MKRAKQRTADLLKALVEAMQREALLISEEARTDTYHVASTVDVSWCPCCGINVRLRDGEGAIVAKWILTVDVAKRVGCQILNMAHFIAHNQDLMSEAEKALLEACITAAGKGAETVQ